MVPFACRRNDDCEETISFFGFDEKSNLEGKIMISVLPRGIEIYFSRRNQEEPAHFFCYPLLIILAISDRENCGFCMNPSLVRNEDTFRITFTN